MPALPRPLIRAPVCSDDKAARPGQWRTWQYEVMLAYDDPEAADAALPPPPGDNANLTLRGPPPPVGTPWRCPACYKTRFETMEFGNNDGAADLGKAAEDVACAHCSAPRRRVGWSFWVAYADLPGWGQAHADKRHASKVERLLRTKWKFEEDGLSTPAGGGVPVV